MSLHRDFIQRIGRRRVPTNSADEVIRQLCPTDSPDLELKPVRIQTIKWEAAYGTPGVLWKKADYYLRLIDHDAMALWDTPTIVLAKAIANLRNYYVQSKAQTIELITRIYNPLSQIEWSRTDIGLIWELVGGYTPSLWFIDERHLGWKRNTEIQEEIRYLLARLTPGGKIEVHKMQELVRLWFPDLEFTPRLLGDAMSAVTGRASKPSAGISYYWGFQLPVRDLPS